MEKKCGDEGCLVDRLEAQFDKGIEALTKNQAQNMLLIRDTIERQLEMVSEGLREVKAENGHAHDEMFHRLRQLEVTATAHVTDAQVRLLLKEAFDDNEEVKSVRLWKESCWKWQLAVAGAAAVPVAAIIYSLIRHLFP